jgi:hypothetical protein
VISRKLNKNTLRGNIKEIANAKQRISHSRNGYIFLNLLLGAFCLTVLTQIGKHLGLKNFLLFVVFNIGISIFLGVISAFTGLKELQVALIAPILIFIFLLIQASGVSRLKAKQNLKVIALSTLQVYSPFFLLCMFSIIELATLGYINQYYFSIGATIIIALGCVIYIAFFLSFFRKLHLQFQALPKA